MIRIAALNDSDSEDKDVTSQPEAATKEAQEEEAFALYNKALQLQNQNEFTEAEEMFLQLLNTNFLIQVSQTAESDGPLRPNAVLKYSTYKNLANIALRDKEYDRAMEFYLEAITLDNSDVTVWYKIGTTALQIQNFALARLAFDEGLKCNPNHWPCLDNLITLLYALNDYISCLYFIAQAFDRDESYLKGLILRDKMFEEQPSLRRDSIDLFKSCSSTFHIRYDKKDGEKYVEESLEIRRIRREFCRPPPLPVLKFTIPWTSYTWKCLGECLTALYDKIQVSIPELSFGCLLDLSYYLDSAALEKNQECKDNEQSSTAANIDNQGLISLAFSNQSSAASSPQVGGVSTAEATPVLEETEDLSSGQQVLESTTPLSEGILIATKRGQKRKRLSVEFNDSFITKRRSARVRNTTVTKKQENVNYCELLQKFLPSSLMEEKTDFCNNIPQMKNLSVTVEKMDIDNADVNMEVTAENCSYAKFLSTEEDDIKNFLSSCGKETCIIDVLIEFLNALAEKNKMEWPPYMNSIYVNLFKRVRTHVPHPSLLSHMNTELIKIDAFVTLLHCELQMDNWSVCKLKSVPVLSPSSNRNQVAKQLGSDFPGKHYREDLEHLVQLTVYRDIFENDWLDYAIRVFWLRAKFFMVQGQTEFAVDCFNTITSYLKTEMESKQCDIEIKLVNCKIDNTITLDEVQKQLESLQRCQSLEEVHRLYEAGEYQQVIDLLTPTFFQLHTEEKQENLKNIPERYTQIQLLQESLWKLDNYQQYVHWGEIALNESLQQYLTAKEKPLKENWFETIASLLQGLDSCLKQNDQILHTSQAMNFARLAQNLIQVITVQLESMELINSNKTTVVHPWSLLYRLIYHEENKIRSLLAKQEGCTAEMQDFGAGVPSSLMLLYNAHEFLGRRSWCCNCDGDLLLLYSDVLTQELKRYANEVPHPYKEDLECSLEQCFFCLYGYPNKRRARHLMDHSSQQISLTWERAASVFKFFKPRQFPEFDSHKTSTISTEQENLFRRIVALVPPETDPATKTDALTSYVEGIMDEPPSNLVDKSIPIVNEVYYLLADYYFKNKEFGKAIRYYMVDLSVDQERLDSWAGMALARSSQLEQKLNSCELKKERAIYCKAVSALRCFQRALEINKNHTTLWIEYGSLSYMLHSNASRQLKQKEQFCLTPEMIETLKLKKLEMLQISETCFRSANQTASPGDDEEWLHHYMLGKISEKLGKSILNALQHYEQAAIHLHEIEARYPRRIQYHNPPDYAMEALEVYYRMHAVSLKYLMHNEKKVIPPKMIEAIHKYLKVASESPFATFQEKSRCTSLNSSDVDEPIAPPPGEQSKHQYPCSITYDHDYFRRKRKDSSTEDSEIEARLRNSTDSSSESLDSATVKDLLNTILAVVTERTPEKNANPDVLVVVGDLRIQKTKSDSQSSTKKIDTDISAEAKAEMALKILPQEIVQHEDVPSDGAMEISSENTPDKTKESNLKNLSENDNKEIKNKNAVVSETAQSSTTKDDEKVSSENICNQSLLVQMCLSALKQCLLRFPQHYKSLYRSAHYYFYSTQHKNLHWSRDYLLGRNIGWQQMAHMPCPGLFSERKNTNLFNGIWRIPNEDIDRPGSFGSHMYRSVVLLIEVLRHLKDYSFLINLTLQLHRNPETGKKFLRDMDRLYLYGLTQDKTMSSLKKEMKKLCALERTAEVNDRIIKHLLSVHRAWLHYVKCASNPDMVNKLLEDTYRMYKGAECEKTVPLLDQAIKFCQFQQSLSKFPKVLSLTPFEITKTTSSHTSSFLAHEKRMAGGTSDFDSALDTPSWRAEALENAAKLLLCSGEPKSEIMKLKEKASELSIKTVTTSKSTNVIKEPVKPSINANTRELINKAINESKQSTNAKSTTTGNKVAWTSNSIPASGMVIGSMTITPIGVNSPPAMAEGLMGRLAGSRPKSPLDLSTPSDTKKIAVNNNAQSAISTTDTLKSTPFTPFDPSRLTADVQSKISSLDPIEHAARSNVSGFQMEFIRQVSQNAPRSTSHSPVAARTSQPLKNSAHHWNARPSVVTPSSLHISSTSSKPALPSSVTKMPVSNLLPHIQNIGQKSAKEAVFRKEKIVKLSPTPVHSISINTFSPVTGVNQGKDSESLVDRVQVRTPSLEIVKQSDRVEEQSVTSQAAAKANLKILSSSKQPSKLSPVPVTESGRADAKILKDPGREIKLDKHIEFINLSSSSSTDLP